MQEFEARLERLKEACGAANDSALARCLGITQGSVGVAKKRSKIPSGWIEQVAIRYRVSTDWLFFGLGRKSIDKTQQEVAFAPKAKQKSDTDPEDGRRWMSAEAAPELGYELVPKVRARLCAGTGSLETEGEVIGLYAFKREFLKRKGQPKRMVLMDVVGDSMEPEIMSGDTVLIDESQREIISGGLDLPVFFGPLNS